MRILTLCISLVISLSTYAEYKVLVMKGCYQTLSSKDELKSEVQVGNIETLISSVGCITLSSIEQGMGQVLSLINTRGYI